VTFFFGAVTLPEWPGERKRTLWRERKTEEIKLERKKSTPLVFEEI
jgi:hypothetical protein